MAPHPGRSFLWALLESGGPSALALLVLFVVARLLGPTELGMAALALGIVQIFAIVPETVMHDALVQRPNPDDVDFDTAFWTCLFIGICFGLGCFWGAPVLARVFGNESLSPLLSVASFALWGSGAGSVATAILRRNFLFKALALRSLYGRLLGAATAVALVLFGFGVWSLIAQYLVQTAVSAVFVWSACPWRPRLRFDARRLREMLSFGIVTMGTRIAWLSSAKLFTVLVGYFLGITAVGYLNVAQRVVDTLHDMLAGAVYNLALPTLSRKQDDRSAFARAYRAATELTSLAIAPVFGGIAICAGHILGLFVGREWLPAVEIVQVLAVGALLELPLLLAEAAVAALGRPGYSFLVSVIALGFLIAAFLVFPPASLLVATLLWVSKTLVCAPVVVSQLQRLIRTSPLDLIRDSWVPLTGTGTMVGFVWLVDSRLLSTWPPLNALVVEVPVGALVYITAIAVMRRDSFHRFLIFVMAGIRGSAS